MSQLLNRNFADIYTLFFFLSQELGNLTSCGQIDPSLYLQKDLQELARLNCKEKSLFLASTVL